MLRGVVFFYTNIGFVVLPAFLFRGNEVKEYTYPERSSCFEYEMKVILSVIIIKKDTTNFMERINSC